MSLQECSSFVTMDRGAALTDSMNDFAMRIVVAGEKNSGKSSLVDLLARGKVLPVLPDALSLLPMVLRHSTTPYLAIQQGDGTTDHLVDLSKIPNIDKRSIILVGADIPHLAFAEIVEVPFSHGAEITSDSLDLMNSADILIWLTIASQAWRLTEKSILESLKKSTGQTRFLAVSRSDKLRSSRDANKILARLERETSTLFEERFLLQASPKLIQESQGSEEIWAKTMGQGMFDKIKKMWGAGHQKQEPVPEVTKIEAEPSRSEVVDLNSRRKAEKKAFELRETPNELVPLREYCETLTGLVSVGLANFSDNSVVSFIENSDNLLKMAEICNNWNEIDQKLNENDVGELTSELTAGNHFLIQKRLSDSNESLFLFCRTDGLNASLARRAFMRLGGLLNERRN